MPASRQVPGVLRHLHYLTRSFIHDGRRVSYINIYARPLGSLRQPPFEFITAQESGFEGIACIDDTARAAVLALQVYEQTRSATALRLAREWLSFVEYMQEPDGQFTNFICDETGRKNTDGMTSHTGGRWWTARAMWALATAYRVTDDPRYRGLFEKGRLAPTSDMKVKGLHVLALMEMYRAQPSEALRDRICTLCDAIVASGPGYMRDRRARADVALWGYHQLQAVAQAGRIFSRLDYIAACETTVHNLIEPVAQDGFYHVYPLTQDYQCVYDISTLVMGLEELFRATGQGRYRTIALECAAWLDGKNPSGELLYDPETGCCSDGMAGEAVASMNCGAESAIEAGFVEMARRRLTRVVTQRVALRTPAAVTALLT